jgi:hypothetical protein
MAYSLVFAETRFQYTAGFIICMIILDARILSRSRQSVKDSATTAQVDVQAQGAIEPTTKSL